ncbi:MAG TPA: FAD/NAD(P)-binding protein [Bacteroidia bacterium]|nr:FAD/NAD(P)-binding protein [Bacteroidia bacterium]
MKRTAIIGAGFTGTMLAVQLIRKATSPFELIIINERETFCKGIAYNPYSKQHLLNVVAGKMSAFPDQPEHFLQWILRRPSFSGKDRELVANSFLPRFLYGEYLSDTWNHTAKIAEEKNIRVRVIDGFVLDLDVFSDSVVLLTDNEEKIEVTDCIIATGNSVPGNPRIPNLSFYDSPYYFRDPWQVDAVRGADGTKPVLIIGNGLTMVDTVTGLLGHGFTNEIHAISPNGFNILPHRHNGLKYTRLVDELPESFSLYDIVRLVNRHIRSVRELGISAEPVIDSIRSHTQRIWRALTEEEKKLFMSRLRHLWGVARHRIPLHVHDRLQQLRIDGQLHVRSGTILDIKVKDNGAEVEYFDKKASVHRRINVSRVINCTGPETDLLKTENSFLKLSMLKGLVSQDALKLGLRADVKSYRVIDASGNAHQHLFTLGPSLKGELWESTAVNELRVQAEELAERLCSESQQPAVYEKPVRK